MRVLVTGSTGFIGSHVVEYLLKNGCGVIATSHNKENAKNKSWYHQVEYVTYDFSDNCNEINTFEFFKKPDVLIHLAWSGLPNFTSMIHIDNNLFQHYNFLKNYIDNGGTQITCIGTCLEYGMKEGMLREDMTANPTCAYAIAKDCLRKFLEEIQKIKPYTLQWVRLFYTYGTGQNLKAILPQLDLAVKNKDDKFNMSGGEQLRDYLPVEDIAKYICKIALQNKITGIINCSSNKPISVRKLVENYITEKKYSIHLNLGYFPYPNYEPMAFWGDNSKIKTILNE